MLFRSSKIGLIDENSYLNAVFSTGDGAYGFMFHSLAKYLAKSKSVESVDVVCGFPNFPQGVLDRAWHS